MPRASIIRQSNIQRTARVMQLEGIFDVPPSERSTETWDVNLTLPEQWNIGVIVGPSGSGKTTVARELFSDHLARAFEWPQDKTILDGFPASMSIKEIVELLSSVGFSSPPSWLRPFHVLSNGEQFRVNMARTLAEMKDLAVVDEFTSVVDRTVAQIGSAAIQKTVRRRNQKFIAVTCHYDILEWLEPDWVYQPHTNEFSAGRSLRRPQIKLEIRRVHHSAWQLFRKHHYLDTNLNKAAACFVAFWNNRPTAFSAWLQHFSGTSVHAKREHRTVCLPDYQGLGFGNAVSEYIAAAFRATGWRAFSTTSHPGMISRRCQSSNWRMIRAPNMQRQSRADKEKSIVRAMQRLTAGFEYVGPPLDKSEAVRIMGMS